LENPLGGRFRLSQPGFFFGLRFLGVHTSTPPSARRLSWRQPPALRPGYADSQAIPSWSASSPRLYDAMRYSRSLR
jgi:hypothetical protein